MILLSFFGNLGKPINVSLPMKKSHLAIIIVQTVLLLMFVVYGLVKKQEADKTRKVAEEQTQLAVQSQAIAIENERRAAASAQEAMRQRELAQQALAIAAANEKACLDRLNKKK
jgi:hypothetical protein